MTVELLHWPQDRERRAELQETNQLRLLLVQPSAAPPLIVDPFEDWVRLPADHGDVKARVESLQRRASATSGSSSSQPSVQRDLYAESEAMPERVAGLPTLETGVLRNETGWVSLPDLEARIVEVLLSRFGRVADRQSLLSAGWPGEEPSRNLLDVHLHRLRRRIEPIGLRIQTVRKRGYLLEPIDGQTPPSGTA
ncbi:MAG: winged helix-turn-helix domain-containing protein [Acidimicrobiales bacterium]